MSVVNMFVVVSLDMRFQSMNQRQNVRGIVLQVRNFYTLTFLLKN